MGNYLPATKGELGEVKKEIGEVKKEIGEVKNELVEVKKELGDSFKDELKKELVEVKKELGDSFKDELKKELAEVKKELADSFKELGEELLEKFEKRLQDNIKELNDNIKFQGGSYYMNFRSIWESDSKEFEGAAAEWKALRQKDEAVVDYYNDPLKREKNVRFSKDNFPATNLFPRKDISMAHLIPNDPSCSLAWLRALSIVTGIDVGNESPIECTLLREFVEGTVNQPGLQGSQRVADPLKSWIRNFLMLPNDHYKYFDQVSSTRQLIITPIWDPKKEWKPGTGYILMVSADSESYKWLLGTDREEEQKLKWFGTGTQEELQTATDFLALTVRALADLLIQHGEDDLKAPFAEDMVGDKDEEHGKECHDEDRKRSYLVLVFESIDGAIPSDLQSSTRNSSTKDASTGKSGKTSGKSNQNWAEMKAEVFRNKIEKLLKVTKGLKAIKIPVLQNTTFEDNTTSGDKRPVLTVDLSIYFEGKEDSIPDPFLVVLKAATSWSVFTNQRLLPACEVYSTSDERKQSGSHGSMLSESDNMRPLEIFCSPASISQREDDDSVMSLSESITGSPGDGLFDNDDCLEQIPAVTPCSAQAVETAVVTP